MSSADAKPEASSSTPNDAAEKVEVMKKAEELMAQGKRNMVCGEVPKAVNNFEEAVKLLVAHCGEMSRDCADAYFHCGGALLELCRMESNVLGSALDGVDIEEEKDEKESEQFEKPPAEDEDKTGDEENGEADDGEAAEENEAEEKDEDGDDVSHFQLAWEYLDVAKVIYQKNEEKDDQLKAAECLLKLGELSMENEQHETAATDLESALTIQKKFLQNDDRIIAETHYQLGLAYGLGKEFEKAIKQYQQAIVVIEAKIVSLNKLVEEKEVDAGDKENRETDDLMKYKNEVKDLKELLPEMKNKIEDTKVEQRDLDKMKEVAKEMLGLSGTTKGFGSPKKSSSSNGLGGSGSQSNVDENGEAKAKPIAHLVRKKPRDPVMRKPEEDESSASPQEVKKIRQDNEVSEMNETGNQNGHKDEKKCDETAPASTPASEPMST